MTNTRKSARMLWLLAVLLLLSACGRNVPATGTLTLEREPKNGGVNFHISNEEFYALGFEPGDSADIAFSNGQKLESIPFYNAFIAKAGDPLLVAYPGTMYVRLAICFGDGIFESLALTEDSTAVISLHEKGTFRDVQEAMNLTCSGDRADYADDTGFAIFRSLTGGSIRENCFYRGASPCDNSYNRAPYVSRLAEAAGVRRIIDLSDNPESIGGYYEDAQLDIPYWKQLYESGNVLALGMSVNYRTEVYAGKTAEVMRAIIREEGPFLIHCKEGKDRTGFVCLLLETMAGADKDELRQDYMQTFANYYGVAEDQDPVRYNTVKDCYYDEMLRFLCGTADPTSEQLRKSVETYLMNAGMSEAELSALREALTR